MTTRSPRVIKIGQHRLVVQRPKVIRWPGQKKSDRVKVWGDYSYARRTIRVKADATGVFARGLLLHEVQHAVWDYTGLSADPVLAKHEERVVGATTDVLLNVLRSNPTLVAYLVDPEAK